MLETLLQNTELVRIIAPVLPEVFIILSTLILLMVAVFIGDRSTNTISWIACFILLVAMVILADFGSFSAQYGGAAIKINFFVIFIKVILLLTTIICLVLYSGHSKYNPENNRLEYPILILFSLVGMMFMISANDFLMMYLGVELQSLCIYILTSFNRDSVKSAEAGIKYFVMGALISGIMLFGISLIYGFIGSIYFDSISYSFIDGGLRDMPQNYGALFGLILVLVAIYFKISAAPFHMWAPDVYEGSPTPVSLFIASAPKIAALVLLFRILSEPFLEFHQYWQQIVVVVAVLSLLVGALGAIMQNNIKRLLAYSAINHIGFMLIGLLVFNNEGLMSFLLYSILYLTMALGAFAFILVTKQCHQSADSADKKSLENLTSFA